MQCDICFRTGGPKLPFLCPTDARNRLYDLRFRHANALVEGNAAEQDVSAALEERTNSSQSTVSMARVEVTEIQAKMSQAAYRTQHIITKAEELRDNIEKAKQDLARRKNVLSRRKTILASVLNGIEDQRNKQINDIEKAIRVVKFKWNQNHTTSASARAFLCGEAARLYGLKCVKNKNGKDEYKIGSIPIIELRRLNTVTAAQISTSLSHIVHLLMLSAHYLGIRLPAEITLPHRDYPLPTILPLQYSYKSSNLPHQSNSHSTFSPGVSLQLDQSDQSRPRPLFINKPLPIIACEDPTEHALFLEGVSLLAYNISWLCESQGMVIGEDSNMMEIFDIGRNMFALLIGVHPRPYFGSRATLAPCTPARGRRNIEPETTSRISSYPTMLGKYSHSTAHSFLGNAEGTGMILRWKLPSPTKLCDNLRSELMSEIANAEWEVLNADAWTIDDDEPMGHDGVMIRAKEESERGPSLGMQSFLSIKTVMDAAETFRAERESRIVTSGWTKLKPR